MEKSQSKYLKVVNYVECQLIENKIDYKLEVYPEGSTFNLSIGDLGYLLSIDSEGIAICPTGDLDISFNECDKLREFGKLNKTLLDITDRINAAVCGKATLILIINVYPIYKYCDEVVNSINELTNSKLVSGGSLTFKVSVENITAEVYKNLNRYFEDNSNKFYQSPKTRLTFLF